MILLLKHLKEPGRKDNNMNKSKRLELYNILSKTNPNPKTELNFDNHFQLLIAVLLSAQATDISVNKATDILFKKVKTPQDLVNLGEENLKEHIKQIGLFNSKAKNAILTANILINKHNSIVPNNRELLEQLPGVGRKTANVVLNEGFGIPTIAVDTHVFRVSNRTGLAKGKTPIDVELKLIKNTPNIFMQGAHHWLILHGRYICKARKPLCPNCPIRNVCDYFKKQSSKLARI